MATNSKIPPQGFHVNLESMDVESSSIEELEDDNKEMDTIDEDEIDWAAIRASHMNLIEDDDDDEDDDDLEVQDEEDTEMPPKIYIDITKVKWNDLLTHESDPDFFLKLCEFKSEHYRDTKLGHEVYNKLNCYRISTSNAQHFQETVRTLVENYMMFGFSNFSNKPYSHASMHDPYWRLLKGTQEIVKMKPSLLDDETKRMLDELLIKKEQSGLWYKIKKLFGLV